jgi:hypothetical protein
VPVVDVCDPRFPHALRKINAYYAYSVIEEHNNSPLNNISPAGSFILAFTNITDNSSLAECLAGYLASDNLKQDP